jgi:predicted AlkP superfamily pyrophosphatase or phosphodiesterase
MRRTRFAVALLKQHSPTFMTVYLASLDHEEHAKGPGTADANRVLEQLDGLVGQLVQVVQQVHPDGIVAVVSDHGFAAVDQDVNLYAPFIKAGLISVKDGEVVDWQAAVWNDGGSAAIVLKNPDDAALQGRVSALLKTLADDPAYGIDSVMDRAHVAKKGGANEASWFVIFKPGFEMGIKPDAPLPAPSHYRGMHGYDPARVDQRATLLIQGKGVAAGRNLGFVDMRDIAPTLAKWLGVSLPQAQGKPLDIKQ